MPIEYSPSFVELLDVAYDDVRIRTLHLSLYIALVYVYSKSGQAGSVEITRQEIMKLAKVSARQTYNKGMYDLENFGYITYERTTCSTIKSKVSFKVLQ